MLLSGLTLREYLTGFALHATPEIKLYKYQVPLIPEKHFLNFCRGRNGSP